MFISNSDRFGSNLNIVLKMVAIGWHVAWSPRIIQFSLHSINTSIDVDKHCCVKGGVSIFSFVHFLLQHFFVIKGHDTPLRISGARQMWRSKYEIHRVFRFWHAYQVWHWVCIGEQDFHQISKFMEFICLNLLLVQFYFCFTVRVESNFHGDSTLLIIRGVGKVFLV